MARTATGLSKKSNRQNLAALNKCYVWREQFGIGVKCSPEFAWVVSGGKFGNKPVEWGQGGNFQYTESEATVDVFKVALYIIKQEGNVK
jgi:hypothetical protein